MTEHEEQSKILKDFINESIKDLEKGGSVRITSGYVTYSSKASILSRHYQKLVDKLTSLGYEYTTNHGFGCKDFLFTKKIEL